MKHRTEIDGLRALAVLPVILFHVGFTTFGGGFLGVDIFFVISGYLITGLILDDLAQGKFSIRAFYARRARRILPALFVMMMVTVPFAFIWMIPAQYKEYSQSLVAVVFFASNILFWRQSGYFAAEAAEKPLLHTWSLGVEEQYYIFFPLALMLLWRFGKRPTFYLIAASTLISLVLSEYASRYFINANFFLLPMRAWELFVGAMAAFHHHNQKKISSNNLLSALGFLLVVIPMFTFSEEMRLPSVYTLAPVVGTAMILLYGSSGSWIGKLFSLPMIVGVGVISYSAYLWHQPLIAFMRINSMQAPSRIAMLALVALSLLIAWASWKWVEQPFRQKSHPRYVANRPALMLACTIATILVAIGIHGHVTDGRIQYWKTHVSESRVRAFELIDAARQAQVSHFYDNGDCVFRINALNENVESRLVDCQKKYGKGIAVIGDSHATNLFYVLRVQAQDHPFMLGLSQGQCRLHSPLPSCYYEKLFAIVKKYPNLFRDIIYEEAGSHLMNKEGVKAALLDLPIDGMVPNYLPSYHAIDEVIGSLAQLTPYARVTWFGPRIEPQIRDRVITRLGCDYPFALRPNQTEVFKKVDEAIADRVRPPLRYVSQIDMMQLDMRNDFITCKTTYWPDGDHFSLDGEKYFAERITLEKILGRN